MKYMFSSQFCGWGNRMRGLVNCSAATRLVIYSCNSNPVSWHQPSGSSSSAHGASPWLHIRIKPGSSSNVVMSGSHPQRVWFNYFLQSSQLCCSPIHWHTRQKNPMLSNLISHSPCWRTCALSLSYGAYSGLFASIAAIGPRYMWALNNCGNVGTAAQKYQSRDSSRSCSPAVWNKFSKKSVSQILLPTHTPPPSLLSLGTFCCMLLSFLMHISSWMIFTQWMTSPFCTPMDTR